MNLLVPNLGSTSLKYQILEMPSEAELAAGKLERVRDYHQAIAAIQTGPVPIDAVALKAVHGGPRYRGTFLIDDGVKIDPALGTVARFQNGADRGRISG